MESKLKQLHFIVLPFPAQGHLNPLLNLSYTLAQKGAFVTIANIEPINRQLQSNPLLCSSPNIKLVGLPFPLDAPTGVNSFWYDKLWEFGAALSQVRAAIEDLVRETTATKPEFRKYVLISDYFLWCGDIAHKYGASFANYWPGTAHWCIIHFHLSLLASKGDIPVTEPEKVITYLPGVEPIKLEDLPNYAHPGNPESGDLKFFINAQSGAHFSKDDWFFVNSLTELEPRAFEVLKGLLGSKCVSVAPLFPVTQGEGEEFIQATASSFSVMKEDNSCMEWLDKQDERSVLYVSFGSIAPMKEAEILALAEALELSEQNFLWVVKREHFPQASVEIFLEFLLRVKKKKQGLVIDWAPQRRVLAHPAVSGFLSHCGWNSVIECISQGVPIIGWPCISEQRVNCKLIVEDWKLGVRVKKMDKEELKKNFIEFTSKREVFENNAGVLKGVVKASVLRGGSSNSNLSEFLRSVAE